MAYAWFHGDISMPESEARLNSKTEGTFLVRFSTSEMGVFTISKVRNPYTNTQPTHELIWQVSSTGISHQRIQRVNGQYIVNRKGYTSLVSLVEGESHALNLLHACGGSRFASLFHKQILTGYLN